MKLFPKEKILNRYEIILWYHRLIKQHGHQQIDSYSVVDTMQPQTLPRSPEKDTAMDLFKSCTFDYLQDDESTQKIVLIREDTWEKDVLIYAGLNYMSGFTEGEALFLAIEDIFGDLDRLLFGMFNNKMMLKWPKIAEPMLLLFPRALNGKVLQIKFTTLEEMTDFIIDHVTIPFSENEKEILKTRAKGGRAARYTIKAANYLAKHNITNDYSPNSVDQSLLSGNTEEYDHQDINYDDEWDLI